MSTTNPFGTVNGDQPKVTVDSGGYFNMSDQGAARAPTIRTLSGTGTVTNFSNNTTTTLSTLTINPQSGDSAVFSGNITNGSLLTSLVAAATGTVALTKNGTGSQTLNGTNNYSGVTTVNSGTLQFGKQVSLYNNTSASWTAANLVVNSGATLALNVGGMGEFNSSDLDTIKALGNATAGFKSGAILGLDTSNAGGSFSYSSSIANPNGGSNTLGLTKLGTGTLILAGNNGYTGGTNLNAGEVQLNHANALGTSGTLSWNGGTLRYGSGISTDLSSRFSTAASQAFKIDTNGNDITFATGLASAGGTLAKSGSGVLSLDGTNTYSGLTNVTAGGLKVNGSLAGSLSVASGATLSGTGTISGATTISGVHTPGNSPGIQNFGGNLTYNSGASVVWELGGNTATQQANPNAKFDQIIVGGTLDFAGPTTLNLSFNSAGSTVDWTNSFWTANHQWQVYDSAALTHASNLTLGLADWQDSNGAHFDTVLSGASFAISAVGNEIFLDFTAATAIPEPATTAALCGAVALLGLVIRRRFRF